jgi:hypothetical protein
MNKILKWDADVKPVAHTRFYSSFLYTKHCSALSSDHFWSQTVIFTETGKKTSTSRLRHIDVEMDMLIFETVEIA